MNAELVSLLLFRDEPQTFSAASQMESVFVIYGPETSQLLLLYVN